METEMGGYHMKKKLLIVDDQNGIRILLMEVFSSEGYETYQAPTVNLHSRSSETYRPIWFCWI